MHDTLALKIHRLHPDATMPAYKRAGDAALDLVSVEDLTIEPGNRAAIGIGWSSEFPPNYVARILGRGGLALEGLQPLAGVVDSNYRGEWKVILQNFGQQAYTVHKGERIAQAIFYAIPAVELIEADDLTETERGAQGFGSSGKH